MTDMIPLAPSDPERPDFWKPIGEITESLFDVIAKYYDAHFDKFLVKRFCDCFAQDGKICWVNPLGGYVVLEERGFRPLMWMPLPNNPRQLPE